MRHIAGLCFLSCPVSGLVCPLLFHVSALSFVSLFLSSVSFSSMEIRMWSSSANMLAQQERSLKSICRASGSVPETLLIKKNNIAMHVTFQK